MKKQCLFLLFLFFFSCNKVLHLADAKPQSYKVETSTEIQPDEEVLEMIAPYKSQIDEKMNEVLGKSAITLVKAKPQSTLGNWMADLIHKKSQDYYGKPIDFAIVNYGGIRIPEIKQGNVTRRKIFEVMPFDNMLVVLKVKGNIVEQLFDRMADYGGWPISKQVRYEIKDGKPQNILIHEKSIVRDQTYKIALSDFIANGGDKCFFFKDQPRDELNHLFRDAIIEFVQEENAQGKFLDAEMDFRVREIQN